MHYNFRFTGKLDEESLTTIMYTCVQSRLARQSERTRELPRTVAEPRISSSTRKSSYFLSSPQALFLIQSVIPSAAPEFLLYMVTLR